MKIPGMVCTVYIIGLMSSAFIPTVTAQAQQSQERIRISGHPHDWFNGIYFRSEDWNDTAHFEKWGNDAHIYKWVTESGSS